MFKLTDWRKTGHNVVSLTPIRTNGTSLKWIGLKRTERLYHQTLPNETPERKSIIKLLTMTLLFLG